MQFKDVYEEYGKLTNVFFKEKTHEEIKEKSQYFTPLNEVDKMLEGLKLIRKDTVKILDPACGTGILILKLLEKIFLESKPKNIIIDAYDIDKKALGNFKKLITLVQIKETKLTINYFNENFLDSQKIEKYDYIITNPPYKKINASSVNSSLIKYLNGQPNLYHLFIAKSLELLEGKGTFIVISPKNYLSGKYTEKIRNFIFKEFSIIKIHTFNERRNVFDKNVLQEICILHISKIKTDNLTLSYNGHLPIFCKISDIKVPNNTDILYTPRDFQDFQLLNKFKNFEFGTIGKKIFLKVGKVVQFRVVDRENSIVEDSYLNYKNGVPLLVYRHINKEKFIYGSLVGKSKNKGITVLDHGNHKHIFEPNNNYLFLRKSTDKKDHKLIFSVPYLKELKSKMIAIDNGLAYFTNENNSLTREEVLGLQCILLSRQFDDYYRMINSSHTINVYELKNMHFPSLEIIYEIGKNIKNKKLTSKLATEIMESYLK